MFGQLIYREVSKNGTGHLGFFLFEVCASVAKAQSYIKHLEMLPHEACASVADLKRNYSYNSVTSSWMWVLRRSILVALFDNWSGAAAAFSMCRVQRFSFCSVVDGT